MSEPRREPTTRRTAGGGPGQTDGGPTWRSATASRHRFWRRWALLATAWALAASGVLGWLLWQRLAAVRPEPPGEPPPRPDRLVLARASFDDLPGWRDDALEEALPALRRTCARLAFRGAGAEIAPVALGGRGADWQGLCDAAIAVVREIETAPPDAAATAVRELLERELVPFGVRNHDAQVGLFTGYYEPLLHGSRQRHPPYLVPLYRRPADLVEIDLGDFRDDLSGRRIAGRVEGSRLVPYADRRTIAGGALAGRRLELLWVDDPVAAFFLQIQGSGQVELDDGAHLRLGYDGQNGHPYFAIGRELIARGALTPENTSLQTIAQWLRSHPAEADEVMAKNASYVFFRELQGDGPIGSAGVALTPGRSLAVDRSFLPMGAPLWLDSSHPSEDGSRDVPLQRLLVSQDTGGAIRGPVRGDVFWGYGSRAEAIAGRMKHPGRLWLLLPKTIAARLPPELFADDG